LIAALATLFDGVLVAVCTEHAVEVWGRRGGAAERRREGVTRLLAG
jgi:hypothetical protein